jgi:hypothetical protein
MPMLIATSGILALLQATAILLLLTALAPASYTDTLIIILFIWVSLEVERPARLPAVAHFCERSVFFRPGCSLIQSCTSGRLSLHRGQCFIIGALYPPNWSIFHSLLPCTRPSPD